VSEVEVTLTGFEVCQEGKRGEAPEWGLGERGGGQGAKGMEEGAEEFEAVEGVDRAQRVLTLEVWPQRVKRLDVKAVTDDHWTWIHLTE